MFILFLTLNVTAIFPVNQSSISEKFE